MTALSELVYGANNERGPWPSFTDKFPVKVNILSQGSSLNKELEEDIRKYGDHLQGRTAAKCLMTRWDMETVSPAFQKIGEEAIRIAEACPLATRTDTDGNPDKVSLFIRESWGLIYQTGQQTNIHNHWPSLWSYTYCISACENCAPLILPNSEKKMEIKPKTSQMILFPAWIMHEVPEHTCEHERIMIAGNLNGK